MCQNNIYVPLHVHSYFSLLDGLPSPRKIAERAKEIGAPAVALSDHGNIFGLVEHHKACKRVGIKPISGIELYMCLDDPSIKSNANNKRHHLTILAKNERGVETLMALVSATNRPDWFYRKPRIDLKHLAEFASDGNLLCLSGCLAGELSSSLFESMNQACSVGEKSRSIIPVKELLLPDWQDRAAQIIQKYQKAFGKENYYIELQEEGMPAQSVVVECLRQMAKDLNIKSVATLDAHYTCQNDFDDHKILLCSQLHTTLEQQEQKRQQGKDVMAFFYLDQFHIFGYDEMVSHYTTEELEASLEIADMIKVPQLGRKPCLPKFTSETMSKRAVDSITYMEQLCITNAKTKLANLSGDKKIEYWNRLKRELRVIKDAELADYFLIVWDACCFVDRHNGPRGKGRGSGAGSLVNYLLGITGIDPIEYGLYFERFYNASRNIPMHFDLDGYPFMSWLSDKFDTFDQRDTNADRTMVAKIAGARKQIKNHKFLKAEAQWIDEHCPKMWSYLLDMHRREPEEKNTCNSHIAYAIGATKQEPKNESAATHPGHTSLPDIDIDIGVEFRSDVIKYLKKRWGDEYVAQMITFGRLQGKAALKEVFRVRAKDVRHLMKVRAIKLGENPDDISETTTEVANGITKHIPDEASIADNLRQMRENLDDQDYGILRWSVDNIEYVREAYEWYKPLFDQAMRLEGTKKSQSKHAAGVVISDRPIKEIVPLAYDAKNKDCVVGWEMGNAEEVGAVKFDFLGVVALDKLWFGQDMINGKKQSDNTSGDENTDNQD